MTTKWFAAFAFMLCQTIAPNTASCMILIPAKENNQQQEIEYQAALQQCAAQATEYFESIQDPENNAVVFDIDNTVLDTRKQIRPLLQHTDLYYFPALAPILELYQYLCKRNFIILFTSTRLETYLKNNDVKFITQFNLANEGFGTYKEIFCKPAFYQHLTAAQWKKMLRERIEAIYGYTIVATFDDDASVFADVYGVHTGKQFIVPKAPQLEKLEEKKCA